jgi:hypothetical protein
MRTDRTPGSVEPERSDGDVGATPADVEIGIHLTVAEYPFPCCETRNVDERQQKPGGFGFGIAGI